METTRIMSEGDVSSARPDGQTYRAEQSPFIGLKATYTKEFRWLFNQPGDDKTFESFINEPGWTSMTCDAANLFYLRCYVKV